MKISLLLQRSDVSRVAMTSEQCVTSGVPPQLRFLSISTVRGRALEAGTMASSRPEARSPGVLSETKMLPPKHQ